jgi:hypothetical protein
MDGCVCVDESARALAVSRARAKDFDLLRYGLTPRVGWMGSPSVSPCPVPVELESRKRVVATACRELLFHFFVPVGAVRATTGQVAGLVRPRSLCRHECSTITDLFSQRQLVDHLEGGGREREGNYTYRNIYPYKYIYIYVYSIIMSIFKILSRFDLEIHEVGYQELFAVDGDVTFH